MLFFICGGYRIFRKIEEKSNCTLLSRKRKTRVTSRGENGAICDLQITIHSRLCSQRFHSKEGSKIMYIITLPLRFHYKEFTTAQWRCITLLPIENMQYKSVHTYRLAVIANPKPCISIMGITKITAEAKNKKSWCRGLFGFFYFFVVECSV